jgi:hypothetical protein
MSAAHPAADLNGVAGERPKARVLDVRCWDQADVVHPGEAKADEVGFCIEADITSASSPALVFSRVKN